MARSILLFVAGVVVALAFDGTLQRWWSLSSRLTSPVSSPDVAHVSPSAPVMPASSVTPTRRAPDRSPSVRIRTETVSVVIGKPGNRANGPRTDVAPPPAISVTPEPRPAATQIVAALNEPPAGVSDPPVITTNLGPTPAAPPVVDDLAPLPRSGVVVTPVRAAPVMAERQKPDAEAIRETLRQYERAFETMDVAATAKVWPSVPRRALARAFSTIRSQGLTFDRCEIEVIDGSATAHCNGAIQFVPKIGSTAPSTAEHEWLFRMHKAGTDWKIRDVTAYQPSTPSLVRTSGTQ